jgi:hypothetical protein
VREKTQREREKGERERESGDVCVYVYETKCMYANIFFFFPSFFSPPSVNFKPIFQTFKKN